AAYVPEASTMSLSRERQGRGMVFAPVGFALVALVLVVSEGLSDQNPIVLVIGGATLACAIVRMAVSFAANQRLLHSSREDAAAALHLADRRMYENKHRLRASPGRQSADVLMAMLQERNPDLGGHVVGVAGLAAAVGERLGITEVELENLRHAGELHDIGKM